MEILSVPFKFVFILKGIWLFLVVISTRYEFLLDYNFN
jgi:hypothetical protein